MRRMGFYLMIVLGIFMPAIGYTSIADSMFPMMAFNLGTGSNGLNIYLYDPVTKSIRDVKVNSNDSWFPGINPAQSLLVFTDGFRSNPYLIKVYDIALQTTTTISTATTKRSAYFDNAGRILFLDSDGIIKRMNSDGTNITMLTTPQSPYSFSVFWLSPDRNIIAAIEFRQQCLDYYTCYYSRVVLINANDGNRLSTMPEYLGEWNNLSWSHDSSRFIYYYHTFTGQTEVPGYMVFEQLTSNPPQTIDLTNSDLGQQDDNVVIYTKSGNLLSLMYQKLYRGQTGTLISNRSDVPSITNSLFGSNERGEIYFANGDKTNFRRFIEAASAADFDGDGKTDIAVYRASTGVWYVIPSGGGAPYGVGWGGDPTDKPVPGDYDGDGKTDIAVYRTNTGVWYVIPSGGGAPYGVGWGGDPTDLPVTTNPSSFM